LNFLFDTITNIARWPQRAWYHRLNYYRFIKICFWIFD